MQAGELNIKVTTDTDEIKKLRTELDQLKNKTEENKNSFKGMAGEFVKGAVIFEALKKGIEVVVNYTKESIKAFNESEKATNRLRQVVGGAADGFIQYAKVIQNTLNIEDEQIMNVISLAKNMGVAEGKLKEVTNTAIGLSKAFGVDLDMATKMAVNATQGNTEALQRYIPTLKMATTEAERQSIIQQAVANGFKIAGAEANTFEGKLTALQIQQGEVKEGFGQIATEIGSKFLPFLIKANKELADFLTNAETQKAIAESLSSAFEGLTAQFRDLNGEMDMSGLSALGVFFNGLLKVIQMIDLAIYTVTQNINLMIMGIVNDIQKLPDQITMANPFASKQDKKFASQNLSVLDAMMTGANAEVERAITEKWNAIIGASEKKKKELDEVVLAPPKKGTGGGYIPSAMPGATTQTSGMSNSEEFSKILDDRKALIKTWTDSMLSQASSSISTVFNLVGQAISSIGQQQLDALSNQHTAELDLIQERLNKELELLDNQGMTKRDALLKEVADKKAAGDMEGAAEVEKQIKIIDLNKAAADQKLAADKAYALKKHKIDVEMFNAKKAMDIMLILMNSAIGIAGAWAGVGQVPPFAVPAAIIQAAILTGIIGTMAAVQIGFTAAQQPPPMPAFASGGIVPGARGVGDNTTAKVGGGEMILNESQQKSLFAMANGGGGGNSYMFYLDGESVPIRNVMIKNRKNEAFRQ